MIRVLTIAGALAWVLGPAHAHMDWQVGPHTHYEYEDRYDFEDRYPPEEAPYVLAQAADPRVQQLEEQVRQLNGRIEELNFQMLQMQERLRKMQEDNEFRFQELEKTDASQAVPGSNAVEQTETAAIANDAAQANDETVRDLNAIEPGSNAAGGIGAAIDSELAAIDRSNQAPELDIKNDGNAGKAYDRAYGQFLGGNFDAAETAMRDFVAQYPDDQRVSDAYYWIGESLLGQRRYRDAAEVFLSANRQYPDANKAPDTLMKLGVSMARMERKDVACATYDEVLKRYPNASQVLRNRLRDERASTGC